MAKRRAMTGARIMQIKKFQAAGAAAKRKGGKNPSAQSMKKRLAKIISGSERKLRNTYDNTASLAPRPQTARDIRQIRLTNVIHSTIRRAIEGLSFKRNKRK